MESDNLDTTLKISVNELKKAITAQYLAAFAALEERNFQQEVLATLTDEAKILKAWTEKVIYRQTDYLTFQVELRNLERDIGDLDLRYRKEFWNLNLICGIGDTVACDIKMPDIRDSLVDLAENSLFLKRFLIDSLQIRNEKLLAITVIGGFVIAKPLLLFVFPSFLRLIFFKRLQPMNPL